MTIQWLIASLLVFVALASLAGVNDLTLLLTLAFYVVGQVALVRHFLRRRVTLGDDVLESVGGHGVLGNKSRTIPRGDILSVGFEPDGATMFAAHDSVTLLTRSEGEVNLPNLIGMYGSKSQTNRRIVRQAQAIADWAGVELVLRDPDD